MALADWYLPVVNESLHNLVYDLFPDDIRDQVKGWWTGRMNSWSQSMILAGMRLSDVDMYIFIDEEMADRAELEAAVSVIIQDYLTALTADNVRERYLEQHVLDRSLRALEFLLHASIGTPLVDIAKRGVC